MRRVVPLLSYLRIKSVKLATLSGTHTARNGDSTGMYSGRLPTYGVQGGIYRGGVYLPTMVGT